jgi:hypothetical protein
MINAEIRVLTQGDVSAYWNLRLEALEREPQSFAESAEEHRATSIELAAARLGEAEGANFVLGAFLAGELVGMAGFFREKHLKARHKGRIWGLYVRTNWLLSDGRRWNSIRRHESHPPCRRLHRPRHLRRRQPYCRLHSWARHPCCRFPWVRCRLSRGRPMLFPQPATLRTNSLQTERTSGGTNRSQGFVEWP